MLVNNLREHFSALIYELMNSKTIFISVDINIVQIATQFRSIYTGVVMD